MTINKIVFIVTLVFFMSCKKIIHVIVIRTEEVTLSNSLLILIKRKKKVLPFQNVRVIMKAPAIM